MEEATAAAAWGLVHLLEAVGQQADSRVDQIVRAQEQAHDQAAPNILPQLVERTEPWSS